MKLEEPLVCLVNKNIDNAIFKIENNKYLLFNGIQTFEMDNEFDINQYIILNNEDTIRFIIIHNARINNLIQELKNIGRGGKHKIMLYTRNAYIENTLNTNIAIEDIYREYDDGVITYNELPLWMMLDVKRKYSIP